MSTWPCAWVPTPKLQLDPTPQLQDQIAIQMPSLQHQCLSLALTSLVPLPRLHYAMRSRIDGSCISELTDVEEVSEHLSLMHVTSLTDKLIQMVATSFSERSLLSMRWTRARPKSLPMPPCRR